MRLNGVELVHFWASKCFAISKTSGLMEILFTNSSNSGNWKIDNRNSESWGFTLDPLSSRTGIHTRPFVFSCSGDNSRLFLIISSSRTFTSKPSIKFSAILWPYCCFFMSNLEGRWSHSWGDDREIRMYLPSQSHSRWFFLFLINLFNIPLSSSSRPPVSSKNSR